MSPIVFDSMAGTYNAWLQLLAVALVSAGFVTNTAAGEGLAYDEATESFTAGSLINGAVPLVSWLAGIGGGFSTMDRLRGRAIEIYLLYVWIAGEFDKATLSWGDTGEGSKEGWIQNLSGLGAESGYIPRTVPMDDMAANPTGDPANVFGRDSIADVEVFHIAQSFDSCIACLIH